MIIDPVSLDDSGFKKLEAMGPFSAIYLTNKDHERDCWNLRKKLNIPVLCHKKDANFLKEKPDDTFSEGSSLKCGIEVFHFLDQKSPGECGFYMREKKVLLLGDALIGDPPGKIRLLPDVKYKDVGKAKAVAQNSGKLKTRQDVNIRLANYPDREFGIVKGKVKSISLTPDKDGNLLLDISLPKGLITSYKKDILFQQEMSGTADVITEDLRLIERLLYQFRSMFKVE